MPKAASENNIKPLIEHLLPVESLKLLTTVAAIADEAGAKAYLVGGVIRDLFLVRDTIDLDVSIEGNAQEIASDLAQQMAGRLVTHDQFGTATVYAGGGHIDLATARTETYAKPGALPTVSPSTIEEDLRRRDFTINALAASIMPKDFGRVVDPLGGRADLDMRYIRVIHDKSFVDDATRMIRGLRYSTRFDFTIDPQTARLIRQCAPMLSSITGDRIRHELVRTMQEYAPEKALALGHHYNVLRELHYALVADRWLEDAFKRARLQGEGSPPVYLSLLAFRLEPDEAEAFINRLKLPVVMAKAIQHTQRIKLSAEILAKPELKASQIFEVLNPFVDEALAAGCAAFGDTLAGQRLTKFTEELQSVQTDLTGNDLMAIGIPQGPLVGTVLNMLKRARLDGVVNDRHAETSMAKAWLVHHEESEKRGRADG